MEWSGGFDSVMHCQMIAACVVNSKESEGLSLIRWSLSVFRPGQAMGLPVLWNHSDSFEIGLHTLHPQHNSAGGWLVLSNRCLKLPMHSKLLATCYRGRIELLGSTHHQEDNMPETPCMHHTAVPTPHTLSVCQLEVFSCVVQKPLRTTHMLSSGLGFFQHGGTLTSHSLLLTLFPLPCIAWERKETHLHTHTAHHTAAEAYTLSK